MLKVKTKEFNKEIIPVLNFELENYLEDEVFIAKTKMDLNVENKGTCVLDAGIKMKIFKSRGKYPKIITLIPQPFQGNVANYKALKPCLEYLKEVFPNFNIFYDDGKMD